MQLAFQTCPLFIAVKNVRRAGHPPSLDSLDVLIRISKRKSESSKALPSTVNTAMAFCTKPMASATAELWGLCMSITYSMKQRLDQDSCSTSHCQRSNIMVALQDSTQLSVHHTSPQPYHVDSTVCTYSKRSASCYVTTQSSITYSSPNIGTFFLAIAA